MRPLALLLLLAACTSGPSHVAILDHGWWTTTLSDGSLCHRPYQAPQRDTADEAIRECLLAREDQ